MSCGTKDLVVYNMDEMGRCVGYRLHGLTKTIAHLVPGDFEPALDDWPGLSSFDPSVAV
jgi:hypothetical protein